MTTNNDQALLVRARLFEEAALTEVYDRYSAGLYRYAWRLLGDAALAEDCVSETFSRFLTALQRGAGPTDYLQAYLYRIAHNWVTDYYRRQPPPSLPLDPELRADPADEPPQVAAQSLARQQVQAALVLLTPEQRQVIMLKYVEDWPNEAIAQALNKPVGAVKALQHRALAALRRLLLPQGAVEEIDE
jgi:RNA polymerase sigma-70 factor (ECF subfamily)